MGRAYPDTLHRESLDELLDTASDHGADRDAVRVVLRGHQGRFGSLPTPTPKSSRRSEITSTAAIFASTWT